MNSSFRGIWVPLVTPMADGDIDLARLQTLADGLIAQGAHGLVVCGDDALLFAALCGGGAGAISASAHIRVDLYVQLYDLVRAGRLAEAMTLFDHLLPVIRLLFSEPNPAPLKAALSMQGLLRDELRLPMTPASDTCRMQLAAALAALDAIPVYLPEEVAA